MAGRSYVYNVARNLDLASHGNGLDADGSYIPICSVVLCCGVFCFVDIFCFAADYTLTVRTVQCIVVQCSIV